MNLFIWDHFGLTLYQALLTSTASEKRDAKSCDFRVTGATDVLQRYVLQDRTNPLSDILQHIRDTKQRGCNIPTLQRKILLLAIKF